MKKPYKEKQDRNNIHEKPAGVNRMSSILNTLMRSEKFVRPKATESLRHGTILTTLGVPLLEQDDGSFFIDMTEFKVFSGIPGFVGYLTNQMLERCRKSASDVLTQVPVDSGSTPELADLGINHVAVYVRGPVARYLVQANKLIGNHMRLVFDALQAPKWGSLLFPRAYSKIDILNIKDSDTREQTEVSEESLALLFPFYSTEGKPNNYFILLEYDNEGRFLRITIEDSAQSRLFLKRIPHRIVADTGRQHFRQDVTSMVEQVFTGIHSECQNQQNEYTEIPGRQPALFDLLIRAGLTDLQGAVFRWSQETAEMLLLQGHDSFMTLLSKILITLEDSSVTSAMLNGNSLEMLEGSNRVFFDLSRMGAMLNISIGEPRKQPDMFAHLKRLPQLREAVSEKPSDILKNYRILFIHHSTSEVLGFIKALQEAGCAALTTLFVRYRGIVPGFLIEDMLSMPQDSFNFYAMQRVELRESIGGAYILSRQYTSLTGLEELDAALRALRGDYYDSMCLAAMHLFFKEAFISIDQGCKLLPVEDGGYLAPLLNGFCHKGFTLKEALDYCSFVPPEDRDLDISLQSFLEQIMPATFEHTANGYYHLIDVEKKFGSLKFPAFTIAVSEYKNIKEAESCAYSILSAIESIFHGLGKCIMHRNVLVMGSKGNIGGYLLRAAGDRVSYGKTCGIDIKIAPDFKAENDSHNAVPQFRRIEDLPDDMWQSLDLFIGMTGISVLKQDFLEKLLIQGNAMDLFFVSGSTKTVEFTDLNEWLGALAVAEKPEIKGHAVKVMNSPVKDPQHGMLQGHRIQITFNNPENINGLSPGECSKNIYMLGDSMPINFLYYGVPGEVIDGVFEELFSLLTELAKQLDRGTDYPAAIYALDRNIDRDANTI